MTWPQSSVPFAVTDLINAGRALNHAAANGQVVDYAKATEIVNTLSTYVASLPQAEQAAVSKRLVAALAEPKRFTPTVAPRKARAR